MGSVPENRCGGGRRRVGGLGGGLLRIGGLHLTFVMTLLVFKHLLKNEFPLKLNTMIESSAGKAALSVVGVHNFGLKKSEVKYVAMVNRT